MVLSFSIGCLFQKIKILILIKLSSFYVNNFLSPLLIRKFFIFWNKHSIEKLRTILNLNFWRRYFWRVYYIWPLSWPIAHRTCLRESRNNVLYRIRRWSKGSDGKRLKFKPRLKKKKVLVNVFSDVWVYHSIENSFLIQKKK